MSDDLIVESLWLLGARDKSSSHVGDYWGNFVPQIPNQILRRFTKEGDWIVDLFSGMGTTLIECRKLGRNGVGVELDETTAARSRARIETADGDATTTATVLQADSASTETVATVREAMGRDHADAVLLHPPYHDIIRFSTDDRDLSNAVDEPTFLCAFERVVANATELLQPGGHLALVIGDAYRKGEWRPLGFECMERCRRAGLILKAINVKDIQGNERGKGKATNLWRYRALQNGFYVFKHEYVMVFRKPMQTRSRRLSAQVAQTQG
jgi:SAM-dependent methyltransferase